VQNWFKPGMEWDQPVAAVAIETPNRIFIGNADQHVTRPNSLVISADGVILKERSKTSAKPETEKTHLHQIMVLNGEGKVIEDWAQWNDLIVSAHSLHINPYDPARHVWVVTVTVSRFSNSPMTERIELTLGERASRGPTRTISTGRRRWYLCPMGHSMSPMAMSIHASSSSTRTANTCSNGAPRGPVRVSSTWCTRSRLTPRSGFTSQTEATTASSLRRER